MHRTVGICFRAAFSSFFPACRAPRAVAKQTQRTLLTLCLGRFDTGVEIGHALAQAFGIAGEYSFAPGLISDPEPSRENANFAQRAFTKGYQGAEEFTEREFMLQNGIDARHVHVATRHSTMKR